MVVRGKLGDTAGGKHSIIGDEVTEGRGRETGRGNKDEEVKAR